MNPARCCCRPRWLGARPAPRDKVPPRRLLGRLSLVPLLLFVGACVPLAGAEEPSGDRERLEAVRREIGQLERALSDERAGQAEAREALRRSETEIGRLSRALREAEAGLRAGAAELERLQARERREHERFEAQRDALHAQLRASQALGREGTLRIILGQGDPSRIGRLLRYQAHVSEARVQQMSAIRASAEGVARLRTTIAREQERGERLRDERKRQLAALDREHGARAHALKELSRRIEGREQRLQSLQEDERALTRLIDRLQEAVQSMPPEFDLPPNQAFASLKGRLPWPVKGAVRASFGTGRTERIRWRGTLIAAEEGAEVRAIYDGRVVFADWMRGFGLLLIIDHGAGYMSLYGHSQSLYKDVGEAVRAGEVVATVGSTGGRSGPGLYFEIRHDGVPDNPEVWCRGGPETAPSRG